MEVLVTGAGGFLGLAIVEQLIARGDRVRGFSRGTYASLDRLGVTQHRGDLLDAAAVRDATAGCDLVIHVAAKAGAWGPEREYLETNVTGTENVLRACAHSGIDKLVYTSTPSVVSRGVDLEGVDESVPHATRFAAHYPATKALAERAVRAADGPRLHTVALRPHLVWGPRDTSLLPRIVDRARRGRLRRIGAVEKRIDTTYVDDAARAHLLAADCLCDDRRDRVHGKAYFISGGEPIGNWTMIDRLLAATGQPPVTRRISTRTANAVAAACEFVHQLFGRQSEPPLTRWVVEELSTAHWFDIGAARRDLGYDPRVSIDEGMQRLADWWNETSGGTSGGMSGGMSGGTNGGRNGGTSG